MEWSDLTLWPEDSPASPSPRPVPGLHKQTIGGSGPSTSEHFATYDPPTSSWRTSQGCLFEGWATYSESWPRSGTTANGKAYRRPPLVRLISDGESSSWPTPTADACIGVTPTPEMADRFRRKGSNGSFVEAVSAKVLFPTPLARIGRGGGMPSQQVAARRLERDFGPNLDDVVAAAGPPDRRGGIVNPIWVEWLMGFPPGWTDCAA